MVKTQDISRGLLVTEGEVRDFNQCIHICYFEDMRFKGSKYTWWNDRTDEESIFKSLDRVPCNERICSLFPMIEVEHLVKIGSDHAPALILLSTCNLNIANNFKFLNFWLKEESFMDVVKANCQADFVGDPFSIFHHKLKRLKKALS